MKLIRLYQKNQAAQLRWIHNHPYQYVALNATLLVGFVAYMEWSDRRSARKEAEEKQYHHPKI